MDTQAQSRTKGSYTANLLGNIKSHLAGLQGFDVMALELIQNADDAEAKEITFDISEHGLLVTNSGQFTYCGDLENRPCKYQQSEDYSCDYHRIVDVGSGGKLSHNENIGRFGIGFVSTYQVTDHPEIRSAGIKLTLLPELGQWIIEPDGTTKGTTFFLPWATNPNSETRIALTVSPFSTKHIDQLAEDIQLVLRRSLLFLRHIKRAEVRRDGKLLLACDLKRSNGSELIVSFRPSNETEQWHILRVDAAFDAESLYESYPLLKTLDRETKISIGIRISPEPLPDGLLYAFLPTEQSTGLPLHINADFFPESDRKAIIFKGNKHEHEWNEMLVDAAATELARDPEGLLQRVGHTELWHILSRAFDLSKSQTHPNCFSRFWERFKGTAAHSQIVLCHDGSYQLPNGVLLPNQPLNAFQMVALEEIGGRVVVEDLRPFRNAMTQLGAPILNLERMVNLMLQTMGNQAAGEEQIPTERLELFFQPLWSVLNDLLPEGGGQYPGSNPHIQKLLSIPYIVSEDMVLVTMSQSYLAPVSIDAARAAELLPRLAIASTKLRRFSRIAGLIQHLDLGCVVSHVQDICNTEAVEAAISVDSKDLRDLYTLFADLDRQGIIKDTVYQNLRKLPIWLSGRGLISADRALLPGNFNDPTGQSDLLDVGILTSSARDFISAKLDVHTQTIEAFVQSVLPRFFNEDGPLDQSKYTVLISELANHSALLNDENISRLLGSLPIIPTQNGKWSRPRYTYRQTDGLVKVLGDATHLWLDPSRIPNTKSVQNFIDSLGIRRTPIAQHLADRMISIADKFLPTEDARRASGEAFYVLCDNYEEWKDRKSFLNAICDLKDAACFPAEGDNEQWHSADSLYAPYGSESFRSQAHILDFKNFQRLKTKLLEELNVSINPETELVINHLLYCVEHGIQPHVSTYIVLNDRAAKADPLIAKLVGKRCIYVESQKLFVRPNQIYWTPQQLGRYAFTIPSNFDSLKSFFSAIGVKNAPEAKDYVDLLLDIVGEHFEQSITLIGKNRSVYDVCLSGIADANELDQLEPSDLLRLQKAPAILNLKDQLIHHDELFLQDSEWHVGFFNGELDSALCKPKPELWPLLEKVGVKRLSDCAEVALEFVDGEMISENLIAEKLMERSDIIARLLHDKQTALRKKISNALLEIKAISHDIVRIQAAVNFGDNKVTAPPTSAFAFFDINNFQLTLSRPITPRSWSHILNALFHQLMPEETSSEISKLTLSIRPLMEMPVEEAHRELSDAGIPLLEPECHDLTDDLTSPKLDDIGSTLDSDIEKVEPIEVEPSELQKGGTPSTPSGDRSNETQSTDKKPAGEEIKSETLPQSNPSGPAGATGKENGQKAPTSTPATSPPCSSGAFGQERSGTDKTRTTKRAIHKQQWDRRLISYVRQKTESPDNHTEGESGLEHNLAVEVIARDAVCRYEKSRGRIAQQMPQTHPGFDIISLNPLTGEERFIEVKGVNGEWNKTGVSMSRLQFSNAQDYGDSYWLYVVEFVSDPDNIRIHPICSPASQVTSFMFDGNWREAVSEEQADPALAFIKGARVTHQHYGLGIIESMELKGSTRLMRINFDQQGMRTVSLNIQAMKVVEDDYGDNAA